MAEDEKPTESAKSEDEAATPPPSDRRKAARIATLVAVPVTLLALFGAVSLMGSMAGAQEDEPAEVSDKPVEITAPDLSDEDFKYCRALITKLPDPLGDLPRRVVAGDHGAPEIAGAWGEPAVTLRCGVEPVEVAKDAKVWRFAAKKQSACWYADESKKATTWTTVDRELAVELTVPAKHSESGQLVQALTKPVDKKIPAAKDAPTGCSA